MVSTDLFERPKSGERALLVHLQLRTHQEDLQELTELARSAGANPVATLTANRSSPNPRYFVGTGKLDEMKLIIDDQNIQLILFNHVLSPVQERNLEQALNVRVLDRNELILDIFAQRARSFEGKMQVELAQLRHLSTRLIRGWTHLERQKGGIGMRGPGETQLETDRRLIGARIKTIQSRLSKIQKQRTQGRRSRSRSALPTVALVGYTNAGKSTLFNALSGAEVYVQDQLFATLDPVVRRIQLRAGMALGLADTVGFIRHLPHELVAAFQSTLLEAKQADLILHVIDVCSDQRDDMMEQVDSVLAEIGADKIPQIQLFNKIDLSDGMTPRLETDVAGKPTKVWLSAKQKRGLDLLDQALSDFFQDNLVDKVILIAPQQASIRAKLFDIGEIIDDQPDAAGGWKMSIRIHKKDLGLLNNVKVYEGGE
ncbi:MAG: ribosome rescue GTPase HflX [Methylococcales bacterium]